MCVGSLAVISLVRISKNLGSNEVCGAAFAAPMDSASVIAEFILLNCQKSVEFENNKSCQKVCANKN